MNYKKQMILNDPFMDISPELWLMLASAVGNEPKVQNLLLQSIDWDKLTQLTFHHKLYPLVYETLRKLNNPVVPEHVLGTLQRAYRNNTMHALNMAVETVRISKCFEAHGIRAVVLKGAPLACRLYGDVAIRPSGDIDILIAPEDMKKTQEILVNEGYCSIRPEVMNMTERQLQLFFKTKMGRHFVYQHHKTNISLELHWKIGYELPMPTESTIQNIEVLGSLIPVLSDDEWLLFLIFHGAGHAWFCLRWLVDIAIFMQNEYINWDKVISIAKSTGKLSFLYQSILLANQLLDVPVPSIIQSDLNHDYVSAWKLVCMAMNVCLVTTDRGSNDKYSRYCMKIYDAQFRPTGGISFFFRFLKPHIKDFKLISLPDWLYVIYYVIRPFTWIVRQLKKLA